MGLFDFLKPKEAEISTQAYLKIAQIRDSIVVLKDGSMRMVLLCSSINLDLKTEQEQDIIIARYQSFLNSLSFPIQILVQSRKMDLSPYLLKLKNRLNQESNALLKERIRDYIGFLQDLIQEVNIMDKKFFVIVPYYPPLIRPPASWEEVISGRPPKTLNLSEFETFKNELIQRAGLVASGLASVGIRCLQLNTQELVELFYNIYNPEFSKEEKLVPVEELITSVIKKGE